MKTHIKYLVIIVILLLLDIFLLNYLINYRSNTNGEDPGEKGMKSEQLIGITSIKDEIKKINTNCILLDIDSQELRLTDLIKEGPILILKISKLNCQTCVDENIKHLKSLFRKHNVAKGKIVILYQESNTRDLSMLRRSINAEISIYQIKSQDKLTLNMDELNVPYFFILDANYLPRIIHVSNRVFPDSTMEYLEIVYEKFLKEEL